jgi:ABC transporter, substrate-binding protein, family 3
MLIAAASVTEERKKNYEFSMPYLSVNSGVLTRKSDNIQKMSDLRGKKVGVIRGSTGEAFMQKDGGYNLVYCKNSSDCYKRLKSGEIDGACDDNLFVMVYPVADPSVEVNIKSLGENVFLGIAMQKGNADLAEAVNQALISLSKEGFFKKAYNDTFEPFYKGTVDKKYFLLDDIYSFF